MQQKSPEAFRTIGEVASWLGVPPHVLRFWESKFAQVRPVKRAGGRRYYRRGDMALLGGIKVLLHDRGMTIKGVQRILSEDGPRAVSAHAPELDPEMALASGDGDAFDDEAALDAVEADLAEEPESEDGPGQRAEAPAEARPERGGAEMGEPEIGSEMGLEPEPEMEGEDTRRSSEAAPDAATREPAEEAPAPVEPEPASALDGAEARPAEVQPRARAAVRPVPVHAFAERAEPPSRAVAEAASARPRLARLEEVERSAAAEWSRDADSGAPRARDLFEDAAAPLAHAPEAPWDAPAPPASQGGRGDGTAVATRMADRSPATAGSEAPAGTDRPAPASALPPPVPSPGGGEGRQEHPSGEPNPNHAPDAAEAGGESPGPASFQGQTAPQGDVAHRAEGSPAPAGREVPATAAASAGPAQDADAGRAAGEVPPCREDEGPLARRPATRPAAVRFHHDAVLALVRRLEAVRDRMAR